MDVCHALADLGASINLMPLSIWKKLSLPELTPTRMTLELADRSITRPKGVAEDVFVKVGSFHFPTDFVVVDFEADPRVPLILGRSFLRTSRALIDVYEGELILRDGDERLIFHVNKHPQKHANESIKMINVSCEDSFGEVLRLKKSNHFLSGSTTPLSNSRPSLTSFETSDSLHEEFADELALLDPFPPRNEDVDVEAELIEIELLLNRDPSKKFSLTITIDPNPEKFTDELAPACLPPAEDDDDEKEKREVKNITEPTAKRQTRITSCLKNFKVIHKESIFHSNKTPQISLVFAITSALPMGDEHLSTFRVEEIVPIPRKSEDTFDNNKGCDLTFCDNNMIFSNPLFSSKDNLTSRDDESFLKEDVQEENFQVYSNPLFEFDDNHNSSDINPLFNEMVEDVETKDSNVSIFDEPVLLNTLLFDEDECFDPRGDNDEIDAFLAIKISTNIKEGYYDSEGDVFYRERLLIDDTTHNLSPEVFFANEPQCFKDESELDTLKNMVKVFDPGIWEKTFSPSCVRLSSKDHHYLFSTIVVQILFTHHVNFLFSFRSEDTIFDPGIFAFHFSSQESVAVKCSMEFCFSTSFSKDE
ncbi:reverse transcriptase domain-containing protein [Tanacetum coccineum]